MKTNIVNWMLYCNICGLPIQEIISTTGGICRGHPNIENELDDILKQFDIDAIADYWKALADKRLVLLKRLEWTPLYFSTLKKIIYTCVVCSQSKEDGHAADCELAEAIAEE